MKLTVTFLLCAKGYHLVPECVSGAIFTLTSFFKGRPNAVAQTAFKDLGLKHLRGVPINAFNLRNSFSKMLKTIGISTCDKCTSAAALTRCGILAV